jgi:ABC-type Zn uptake system ZnuABC Zn-binding protein ZnuA
MEKLLSGKKLLQPYKSTRVITYHKSFDYLIDYFEFELFGTIEPKPGIEPSPSHINELIQKAKNSDVKLIIIEPNRPKKTPNQLSKMIGAKMVILPLMPVAVGLLKIFLVGMIILLKQPLNL